MGPRVVSRRIAPMLRHIFFHFFGAQISVKKLLFYWVKGISLLCVIVNRCCMLCRNANQLQHCSDSSRVLLWDNIHKCLKRCRRRFLIRSYKKTCMPMHEGPGVVSGQNAPMLCQILFSLFFWQRYLHPHWSCEKYLIKVTFFLSFSKNLWQKIEYSIGGCLYYPGIFEPPQLW